MLITASMKNETDVSSPVAKVAYSESLGLGHATVRCRRDFQIDSRDCQS
jgi:hypothetical protein